MAKRISVVVLTLLFPGFAQAQERLTPTECLSLALTTSTQIMLIDRMKAASEKNEQAEKNLQDLKGEIEYCKKMNLWAEFSWPSDEGSRNDLIWFSIAAKVDVETTQEKLAAVEKFLKSKRDPGFDTDSYCANVAAGAGGSYSIMEICLQQEEEARRRIGSR
jgi:hypothetical protein